MPTLVIFKYITRRTQQATVGSIVDCTEAGRSDIDPTIKSEILQYSAFSLIENHLQENMGRESSIPVRAGHFYGYSAESAVSYNENARYIADLQKMAVAEWLQSFNSVRGPMERLGIM